MYKIDRWNDTKHLYLDALCGSAIVVEAKKESGAQDPWNANQKNGQTITLYKVIY